MAQELVSMKRKLALVLEYQKEFSQKFELLTQSVMDQSSSLFSSSGSISKNIAASTFGFLLKSIQDMRSVKEQIGNAQFNSDLVSFNRSISYLFIPFLNINIIVRFFSLINRRNKCKGFYR